jgi:hypothetical protein
MESDMTITQILDHWRNFSSPTKLIKGVPDSELLAFVAFATILLGQRAQTLDRKDVQRACRTFIEFLNKERAGTTHKTYRMAKGKPQ